MSVTAIVLAAGRGLRLKFCITKPLVKIKARPIIIYSLLTLSNHSRIKDIIVTANSLNYRDIVRAIKQYRIKKIRAVVLGGKERQDSVLKALQAVDADTDLVLIHDAVRPFIDGQQVSNLIREAEKSEAAILGVPVKNTIKEAKGSHLAGKKKFIVRKTLDRSRLWEIQTPQVFSKSLILKAYAKFGNHPVTDDAMLVEKLGAAVSLVEGAYDNIKVTTPEDLIIAEAILGKGKGKGYFG
ncbi:2-C-methyl-D-erythritol 4-phosphate cytidylyltransferase [bacterium]|nr:MAG: 2-C-methyl-D-erythritol 4-phosphate cytidylyltransferase [bacterium]